MPTMTARHLELSSGDISHGWIGSEIVGTRLGRFEFQGGYPTPDAASKLADALFFNRAVEVYLAQMPAVSWVHVWTGFAETAGATPNQVVVWETLMDAATILLTGNTETVYGLISF